MPRRAIKDIRGEELVEAAVATVAEEGHDAATTRAIGLRAGVSPGIVHHYFGDKHSLLLAAMRAVRRPVAAAYRARLAAAENSNGTGREALEACFEAHLDPEILTVRRAVAWLQFTSRVAHLPDYARIRAAVRGRQVAALRRALSSIAPTAGDAAVLAKRLALQLDGLWLEAATREGGLAPGEGRALLDATLSDSIW
jgi:AcrR family transcriptional regulator